MSEWLPERDIPRKLPPVRAVLDRPELGEAISTQGREAALRAVRASLAEARNALDEGRGAEADPEALAGRALAILAEDGPRLRPVLNASGVLLHTGLGRAPLAKEAAEAVAKVVRGYCNLELDLGTGERGKRTGGVAELLRRLTGAEAAAVVNNNAAATILALRATAAGREVIVSRGQLVEIGGSFRLPEIFEVSGARLREVGTTNKTRLADYERAIGPETAAILRVHPSNYRVVGFTESAELAELVALAKSRGLWTIDDIGSGALTRERPPGIEGEPTVAEGLAAGADLILFSGDKLLGGPQCGLILGSKAAVSRLETDPLMRALRVDKMTLAALEATLHLALDPDLGLRKIPLWAFLATPLAAIRSRAGRIAEALRSKTGLTTSVVESTSHLGGGSVPLDTLPTAVVRISAPFPAAIGSEAALAGLLRRGDPPVLPRVHGGSVLLDPRAIPEDEDDALISAVVRAVEGAG